MVDVTRPARVLGIVGSPRKQGNTERLTDALLSGAKSAGLQTEKILLSEYEIGHCHGCLTCYPDGSARCTVHDDQMPTIVERMKRADVWVLATPIYCYGPTSLFKAFLDRWIALLPQVHARTRAAALLPLNQAAPGADPTLAMLRTTLRSFNIPFLGERVFPGLLHLGDLDRHEDYVEEAASFGREIAEHAIAG